MRLTGYVCLILPLLLASQTLAQTLVVQLPDTARITSATATKRTTNANVHGTITDNKATFAPMATDEAYDIRIEQADGLVLCGCDMNWCDPTPADANAEAIADDDRKQIDEIVKNIPQFANKVEVLKLEGDHNRAVALIQGSRTNAFHSAKGDEVIWRVMVWFFKWENGAWERVPNQERILRRERFSSQAEWEKELTRIRWVDELGGVHLAKNKASTQIEVKAQK